MVRLPFSKRCAGDFVHMRLGWWRGGCFLFHSFVFDEHPSSLMRRRPPLKLSLVSKDALLLLLFVSSLSVDSVAADEAGSCSSQPLTSEAGARIESQLGVVALGAATAGMRPIARCIEDGLCRLRVRGAKSDLINSSRQMPCCCVGRMPRPGFVFCAVR